jgi:lipoprotein-anchoring transpeptidase ErfK/SrfK
MGDFSTMRRILLVLAVMAVGSLGVVTAATAEGGRTTIAVPRAAPAAPGTPAAPGAAISYAPAAGAGGVKVDAKATATVADGTFDDVTLTGDDGKDVPGELNADRTVWTATAPLVAGVSYTWGGHATGSDGTAVPLTGSFATAAPSKRIRGTINIGDGRTVGVAAPVRIQFNDHVVDRAAVERALKVETSVPVEGSWGWLPDEGGGSRVDWRPKVYWPAHTSVTVTANLRDVPYGGGAVGAADVSSRFTIGRAQIVKADATSFRLVVIRDGAQVFDFPASYGLGSDPDRNTRSGVHVVSEKFTDKRMVSERYGYDLVEKWAVRMSNNGEFIHANPASTSAQGTANVTHGCVNLSVDNAKAFYDSALYGDPVEVTNTPVQLSPKDGDIWDWTLSWDRWKALSAL